MFSEIRTSLRQYSVYRARWIKDIGVAYNGVRCRVSNPRAGLERSAGGDLWKNTLSKIPTQFGKLAYLASLRDPNSGIYRHHGLSAVFGREESNRALRQNHEQAFFEWLNLPLSEKSADLMAIPGCALRTRDDGADHWLRPKTYRNQMPERNARNGAGAVRSELEALLETIRNAWDGEADGQASSRRA